MSDQHNGIVRIVVGGAVKSSPGAAVIVWGWLGHNISLLVGLFTVLYLVVQTYLAWLKVRAQHRHNRDAERRARHTRTASDE